jgi:uncharacterized protein
MSEAYQLFSFHDRLGEKLGKPLIVGFPDTGLAGAISVSYVVDKLELEEVGYIDSSELPPILPVRRMEPKELIRIYDSRNFLTIVSEIPVPPTLIRPFASDLLNWAERKGVSSVVCLTGIAEPKRLELESPTVFMVSSKPREVEKAAKWLECEVLSEGFITGIHAEILRLGMRRGLEVLILLAQSHLNYPDPGAAAQLLNKLSRLVNEKIDVKPLLESEEVVRLQLRDLMRRTAEAMVQKSREMELPPVYR